MLTARDHRLASVNARLDQALERRVQLHQARERHEIDVPEYLQGLEEVRAVEDELESVRRAAGKTISRAMELAAQDGHPGAEVLVLEAEAQARRDRRRRDTEAEQARARKSRTRKRPGPFPGRAVVEAFLAAQEPPRMPQQLDLEGNLHDLAPDTHQPKLFEPTAPAPQQLEGQQQL